VIFFIRNFKAFFVIGTPKHWMQGKNGKGFGRNWSWPTPSRIRLEELTKNLSGYSMPLFVGYLTTFSVSNLYFVEW
jgi:hypothetical protein